MSENEAWGLVLVYRLNAIDPEVLSRKPPKYFRSEQAIRIFKSVFKEAVLKDEDLEIVSSLKRIGTIKEKP